MSQFQVGDQVITSDGEVGTIHTIYAWDEIGQGEPNPSSQDHLYMVDFGNFDDPFAADELRPLAKD